MLSRLGARVTGFALPPPTSPSLFDAARIGDTVRSIAGDLREPSNLTAAVAEARPEIVFHLAAQPLVRQAYVEPVQTFDVNVMGTVYLLEAMRTASGVEAVVVITSDKVYDNVEWFWGYRETDRLGGKEPYGVSKACAELVVQAYAHSYFRHAGIGIATARAGNVIGGGDWAANRLVPDAMRAWSQGAMLRIRNPGAVRPWQHVLEPIRGYLLLAEQLAKGQIDSFGGWNFGPARNDLQPVASVVERLAALWGGARWEHEQSESPYEAGFLAVDSSRAEIQLGWRPAWGLEETLARTVAWYRDFYRGSGIARRTQDEIESNLNAS